MPELDIQGILRALVEEGVEFLVIGGVAVGYHGHIRATKDVDIVQWIGDDALWQRLSPAAVEDEIAGLRIKMVGYEDLIALKEQAGRPEDVVDLERLRQARNEQ